jgi:3'(2'), 5'-bisphosphate nucleotidase
MAGCLDIRLDVSIDVEAVIAAARAAGDVILGIYNGEAEQWQVEQKADNSPLTRADREANTVICGAPRLALCAIPRPRCADCCALLGFPSPLPDRLQRLAPHIPIVSEENAAVGYDVRRSYQYSWCVDPLDGTKVRARLSGVAVSSPGLPSNAALSRSSSSGTASSR